MKPGKKQNSAAVFPLKIKIWKDYNIIWPIKVGLGRFSFSKSSRTCHYAVVELEKLLLKECQFSHANTFRINKKAEKKKKNEFELR